ncbi:MAG: universal stress protein [Planctomycetota bacterium]|jgi:nucleotide-binding universal stress UspA family protein
MARRTFSTILLFAEGSDEGMKAAKDAIALADDENATLIIASVVDTSTLKQLVSSRIFVQEEMEEYEQELEESCRKQLNYIAQLADRAGVKNRTALLTGACHTAVLREQRARNADLLVMGAYRATTARRDLMAREKQLIVDEIPCPVLLVR